MGIKETGVWGEKKRWKIFKTQKKTITINLDERKNKKKRIYGTINKAHREKKNVEVINMNKTKYER